MSTDKRVSRKTWLEADTGTVERVAELYGVAAPERYGMTHVGWLWRYSDGSYAVLRIGESTRHREQPSGISAVYAVTDGATS